MKAKHLSLGIAALLAAGGLWFAWSSLQTPASHKTSKRLDFKTPGASNLDSNSAASLPRASQTGSPLGTNNRPTQARMLRPPNQTRIFHDFTPEERVKFARKGRGPGG